MDRTIDYYNKNAAAFVESTVAAEFEETQTRFIKKLKEKASILDLGCGSGRDAKYFLSKGFVVEATDGSEELCEMASAYVGITVKKMLFQELDAVQKYDGIWACSSILHLSKIQLKQVLKKMVTALKDDGIIYTSFKYGDFEGDRNGRYFTDFTIEGFTQYIADIQNISMEEYWITGDVRPGRENEKWLNVILRKMNF